MKSRLQLSSDLMPESRLAGHTLVELLIVVALLALVLAVPALNLVRGVERAHARGAGQLLQGAVALAQVETLRLGVPTDVECGSDRVRVGSGRTTWESPQFCDSIETNVPRWRDAQGGIRIRLSSPFGSPSSAGSVEFLPAEGGTRVVVRAASGLTRREMP